MYAGGGGGYRRKAEEACRRGGEVEGGQGGDINDDVGPRMVEVRCYTGTVPMCYSSAKRKRRVNGGEGGGGGDYHRQNKGRGASPVLLRALPTQQKNV